ncbi:MAG: hypothetical protein ACK5LP_00070, partial [Campylobacteraceae bacterium]
MKYYQNKRNLFNKSNKSKENPWIFGLSITNKIIPILTIISTIASFIIVFIYLKNMGKPDIFPLVFSSIEGVLAIIISLSFPILYFVMLITLGQFFIFIIKTSNYYSNKEKLTKIVVYIIFLILLFLIVAIFFLFLIRAKSIYSFSI